MDINRLRNFYNSVAIEALDPKFKKDLWYFSRKNFFLEITEKLISEIDDNELVYLDSIEMLQTKIGEIAYFNFRELAIDDMDYVLKCYRRNAKENKDKSITGILVIQTLKDFTIDLKEGEDVMGSYGDISADYLDRLFIHSVLLYKNEEKRFQMYMENLEK